LEIVVSSGLPVKGVDVRVEAGNPPTIVFTFGTGMNRWEQFKMPYGHATIVMERLSSALAQAHRTTEQGVLE
jgi:hypothetical protein